MVANARRKLLGRARKAVFHCAARCVRRAWNCPSGLLRDGGNTVRVAMDQATGSILPVWVDLAVR